MTNWTPEQQAFIDAVRDTPDSIRLDAVAGSGKTTTLTYAARGIPQDQKAIALAFNKNIAEDMAKKFPSRITCKTLNSVGHGIWLKATSRLQLDPRKMGDLTSKWCSDNLNDSEQALLWPAIRTIVQAIKSGGYIPPQWHNKTEYPGALLTPEVIEHICDTNEIEFVPLLYQAALNIILNSIAEAFTSRIDFDDQLYMATYFTADELWPSFDVVMVDEAQDLSPMQHDMIERLGAASRLLVVGDERQAIYGWRGASAKSLDDLQRRFKLRRMPLTVSFRCPENIIKHAQRIVPYIKADKPGGRVFNWEVDKETDEGGKAVNPGPAWFPEDFVRGSVVLCRNNAPLIKLGFAFIRYGIPCYFTGRDMAASLKKIVQALPTSTTLQSALQSWYEDETDKLMEKKKYAQLDAVTDRYEALSAIILGSSAQDKTSLIRGIEKLFMRQPSPEAIELSTIHKAKGKEWPIVYFLNEHLIPGRWVLEAYNNDVPGSEEAMVQEDNLRYVAVTRAMDTLVYFTLDRDTSIISRAEWEAKLKGESNE